MIAMYTRMRCVLAVSRSKSRSALAWVALFLFLCASAASATEWEWKTPIPQGNTLRAIAHGGDSYVAVAKGGTILISDDGASWSLARAGGPDEALYAVAYGNGAFVAVGEGGAVLRSTDGRTWTPATSATTTTLRTIAYGNAGFVACGDLTLVTSTDGLGWTAIDAGVPPGIFGPSFQNVAFGNDQYVVWEDVDPITATSPAEVLISSDTVQWTRVPLGPFPGHDSNPLFHRGLVFANGAFVALTTSVSGISMSLASNDGTNWSAGASPTYEGNLVYFKGGAFAATAGRYVALANLSDPPPPLDAFPIELSSSDGLAWSVEGLIDRIPVARLSFANSLVFGMPEAGGGLYVETDALNWTARIPASPAWFLSSLGEIEGTIIAAGHGPLNGSENVGTGTGPMLIASVDRGATWTRALQSDGDVWGGSFNDLAHGTTHLVAVGSELATNFVSRPIVYSSVDGQVWLRADLSGAGDLTALTGIAYGAGLFVATGTTNTSAAEVLVSDDDGISWQPQVTNLDQQLGRIVFADGTFAAISSGFSTSVYFSQDAINWSDRPTGTAANYLLDLAYHGGIYVALGTSFIFPTGSVSTLSISTDGVTWEMLASAPTKLVSVSSAQDGFIAAGSDGRVFKSSDARTWSSTWSGSGEPLTTSIELVDGRVAVATSKGGVLMETGDAIFSDGFDVVARR
jgi:hypothetical protein